MTNKRSLGGLLHWATHRVAGVPAHVEQPAGHQGPAHVEQPAGHQGPAHVEQPAGHQGRAVHGRTRRRGAPHRSLNHRWNHSSARPARVVPAWQRRIAALFGREL